MSQADTSSRKVVPPRQRLRALGFTLMELMVTLSVAAILLAIAAPSFTSIFNTNRLAGSANELLATLQSARIEAVRRNLRTVVCRSDDGSTCNTAGGNWGGWLAFVDTNANGVYDPGPVPTGDVLLRTNTIATPVVVNASPAVSGASSRIVFRPDGFAHAADGTLLVATIGVCIVTTQPTINARDVSMVSGSRVSVVTPSAARAACAAPPTD